MRTPLGPGRCARAPVEGALCRRWVPEAAIALYDLGGLLAGSWVAQVGGQNAEIAAAPRPEHGAHQALTVPVAARGEQAPGREHQVALRLPQRQSFCPH